MRFGIFATTLCLVFWNYATADRDTRKLFGGYRITPRLCKPTRADGAPTSGGPNVCMFNHECLRRDGRVVGACMDGFLFGACCELPAGASVGALQDEGHREEPPGDDPSTTPFVDITSGSVSKITASLLDVLPTAEGDEVVQIGGGQAFPTSGLDPHRTPPDTILQHQDNNDIDPGYFRPTSRPVAEDRKTTLRTQEGYSNTPIYGISLSNGPLEYTTVSGFNRPMFRPKPPSNQDEYVLVPTITHDTKSNKTQQFQSVVNIVQLLNSSSGGTTTSTSRPPSTSYVYSTNVSRRPTTTGKRPTSTSKPPSTSYVYGTTVPPRRTQSTTTKKTTKPTRKTTTTTKRPSYIYSLAPSKTTLAYSPDAFVSPSNPTRRPLPSVAPTVIVLGAIPDQNPPSITTPYPQRKPSTINQVTINNHITQNIYSTTERPSPTVLITPKPSISTSQRPQDDYEAIEVLSADGSSTTPTDDDNNFPPVRNPNLNVSSLTGVNENDVTTPVFAEDEALDDQVESFVNQIIQGLQEPFQGLKEVVYNRRNSTFLPVGAATPTTTTRRTPTTRPNARPSLTRPTTTTTGRPATTRRPTKGSTAPNRRTTTTTRPKSTRKPVTTTQSFIEHETEGAGPASDSEDYRTQCGVRPLMKTGRIVGGKGATFGEFPWQVLVRESTWLGLFTKNKCGGVLISRKYVMTAAHCQPGFLASLVAVFGEFDISGDLEKKRPISRNVKRVIVHRQYDPTTFENDLALLELEQPVHFDAHILPICLPRDDEDFTGRLATVTGWGRLKYGGGVPSVLQEVQVPIMENPVCQEMFRTAGHTKVILDSFLCAGYANGQKDSCEGDSGGPLVLQRPDGRYQLAGTVSHGIKCAAPYLPGVYMRTQYFKPWITSITGVTSP